MKRPNDIKDLEREIQRLRDAKRRALSLADERAKETVELRLAFGLSSRSAIDHEALAQSEPEAATP